MKSGAPLGEVIGKMGIFTEAFYRRWHRDRPLTMWVFGGIAPPPGPRASRRPQPQDSAEARGAHAMLTNVEIGKETVARTHEDGTYEFPATAVGWYGLEITKRGFAKAKVEDLELKPSGDLYQDVTLSVGEAKQIIVRAHRPVVITAVPPPVPQRTHVGG